MKNSIMNYFKPKGGTGATPTTPARTVDKKTVDKKTVDKKTEDKTEASSSQKGTKREVISSSGDGDTPKAKRKREEEDEDEDEDDEDYVPIDTPTSVSGTPKRLRQDKENDTPNKRIKQIMEEQDEGPTTSKTPRTPRTPSTPSTPLATAPTGGSLGFNHLQFPFLDPLKRKDKSGLKMADEGFDPSSLYVPQTFLGQQTPAQRQWWILKADHFDTLLFFKMGKFYELFHMDAVVAVQECGLCFMARKEYAHCGFPEAAFQRYVNLLVDKGHRVARIEQTETPKMMEERCKKMARAPTKYDKVVQRKICQQVSVGSRTFGDGNGGGDDHFLMAVLERRDSEEQRATTRHVGLCFACPALSKIYFGQLEDDALYSKTCTLLSFVTPAEVLNEKGNLSPELEKIVKNVSALKHSTKRFPKSADDALKLIRTTKYLDSVDEVANWPQGLKKVVDTDSLTPRDGQDLALRALGVVITYYQEALVDEEVVSYGDIQDLGQLALSNDESSGKAMVLYGETVRNLDILPGSHTRYNLFTTVNKASTPFGKRLLKQWVCNPLLAQKDIEERQEAMRELEGKGEFVAACKKSFKVTKDLEKLMSWIHGACVNKEAHPEMEAVYYETETKLKRNINNLVYCLLGFEELATLFHRYTNGAKKVEFTSKLLQHLIEDQETTQTVVEAALYFRNVFDFDEALEQHKILPAEGVDEEYDALCEDQKQIETDIAAYLKEQGRHFGATIKFFGSGPNRFQLEVPENVSRKASKDHIISSQRKGFKRYTTHRTDELKEEMIAFEERKRKCLAGINVSIMSKFLSHRVLMKKFLGLVTQLDCLISLAEYGQSIGGDSCFPTILASDSSSPKLSFTDGRHPILISMTRGDSFIPNDVDISGNSISIITGANMGGKSTIMRQCGLLAILAQLGCRVPAGEMSLTPVDRVFSRMGASDRIMEGASTFYVELSETANILKNATPKSLVIVDELGRGTTTYDGRAIAKAVLHDLAGKGARTLFSTHYHELTEHLVDDERFALCHMALLDATEDRPLTFLYKLLPGRSDKSHGFNAALAAGIDKKLVDEARRVAAEYEQRQGVLRDFKRFFLAEE